jgi:hypothetical protein
VPFLKEDFQICSAKKQYFSALRVHEPPPDSASSDRRFVRSVINGLLQGHETRVSALDSMTMSDALALRRERSDDPRDQLIIIDQMEEVLTLDPANRDAQTLFFRQLGEALDDPRRWALLAMREDYMGGLDRFLPLLPGRLRTTYRLDFLSVSAAERAMVEPAKARNVSFLPEATDALLDDLRKIKVEDPDDSVRVDRAPYVEPVMLQVVCHRLWRRLDSDDSRQSAEITAADVERFGSVNRALRRYYADAVVEVAGADIERQRAIRDWFEDELITEAEFRSQTRTGPELDDRSDVLAALQDRYLIRGDQRAEAWWELSHDRLIKPVLSDNASWRRTTLSPWRVNAHKWHRRGHDRNYLLERSWLEPAQRQLAALGDRGTSYEKAFVEESAERVRTSDELSQQQAALAKMRAGLSKSLQRTTLFLTLSICLNIILVLLVVRG